MIKEIKKTKKGFTLVESLVAISILMIAVTGPMVVAQKGLFSAIASKDQMIAAFLAQDAIEYIKNVRDTNGVVAQTSGVVDTDPNAWLAGLDACVGDLNNFKCNVDTYTGSFDPSYEMCIKRDKNTEAFFGYGIRNLTYSNVDCLTSKFSRYIVITQTESDREAYIDVLVTWGTGDDQKLRVGSYIYNYWGNLGENYD